MSATYVCTKCGFQTDEALQKCLNCGGRVQSIAKVKTLGWLLLILGTFLVLFMGGIGGFIATVMNQSSEAAHATRFTGGPQDIALIIAIFGLVISFGLASMVGGVWQIIYGRPNRKLMIGMLLVAGILVVLAEATTYLK